jgi:hypothetical protein
MTSYDDVLKTFDTFAVGTGGIGGWIGPHTDAIVLERIRQLDASPLSHAQLNQLLILGREAPVSEGFFKYYWLSTDHAPYDVKALEDYPGDITGFQIVNALHLRWGLRRIFVDCLLFFGNVRSGFRSLRQRSETELRLYFRRHCHDFARMQARGAALTLRGIPKDNRYLISEMACKSFGDAPSTKSELRDALFSAFRDHRKSGKAGVSIKELLSGETVKREYGAVQANLLFSADDTLEEVVENEEELVSAFDRMADAFLTAREQAIENTKLYLSMVSDLDVYVATSMRTRDDFRRMAETCERVFGDKRLQALNVRYFDPTMSAAAGHEDKGLIECLMVKAAKALLYVAGDRDSYGKDAEAAMALSQGKPVIFLCNSEAKSRFYRDVHPLSRLIDFRTGVAVGAMATDKELDVPELLLRIFQNRMQYQLEKPRPGYLRLREVLTQSIVRLQTNDEMLTEAFWNHYHEASPNDRID